MSPSEQAPGDRLVELLTEPGRLQHFDRYHDGSGSAFYVIPARSAEHAAELAVVELRERFAAAVAWQDPNAHNRTPEQRAYDRTHRLAPIGSALFALGVVDVPALLSEAVVAYARDAADYSLTRERDAQRETKRRIELAEAALAATAHNAPRWRGPIAVGDVDEEVPDGAGNVLAWLFGPDGGVPTAIRFSVATIPGTECWFDSSHGLGGYVGRALSWWRISLLPGSPGPGEWAWTRGPAFEPDRLGFTAELPPCVPDSKEGAP